jgi:sulfur carrier protein ThiS
MNVKIEKTNKSIQLKTGYATANLLLKELGISPSTVLIVRNGEVILPDEELSANDDVVLLSVVSGG